MGNPPADAIRSLLFQFNETQWWPQARLRGAQFVQATALLRHASAASPAWRERLAGITLHPHRPIDEAAWCSLPVLRRAELQSAGAALHCEPPAGHGPVDESYTSGSTGMPVRTLTTRYTRLIWEALTAREHLWHRRDLSRTLGSIRVFGTGAGASAGEREPRTRSAPNWSAPMARLYATGPSEGLDLFTPLEKQIEWLLRVRPAYLLTHPTNALALAEHCIRHDLRVPGLLEVRTFGESPPQRLRETVHAAWAVPVTDVYSSREAGVLAFLCPEEGNYHVMAEGAILEVLRDDGSPSAAGETGRVVVTPLHNFASPLIRYDIGDLAETGGPCPCGRGLPVIARIYGRVRNMLRRPDGTSHWPSLPSREMFAAMPTMTQHQFVQKALDRIEVRIVAPAPATEEQAAGLLAALRQRFGEEFSFDLRFVGSIGRSAGGKFEEFSSEVAT
jgi:phenylacetate-CoA ligase